MVEMLEPVELPGRKYSGYILSRLNCHLRFIFEMCQFYIHFNQSVDKTFNG